MNANEPEAASLALNGALWNIADINDDVWDQMYPAHIRRLSALHWTPINLVRAVMEELQPRAQDHLLDLGSGVGKFCMMASLLCQAQITGVEQREQLHRIAVWCAKKLKLRQGLKFICQDAFDLDWDAFSIIYAYNPFQEHLQNHGAPAIDETIALSDQTHGEIMAKMWHRLEGVRPGTKVVCLYGWGGGFPPAYHLLGTQKPDAAVEIWQKR
jgi:SAM-dependent methyltransferase